ncbi:oligosaccharide flippase family protein [Dokdonia sp.]|uniref:oligosaccharide flippase family protein n=1 Tax=Dokdonia sp. TaxID=2024995 RepID=UPI0032653B78
MSTLKRFFKDTVIYGLATVLPRLMGIILVRLHTDALPREGYADVASFYVGAAFLNIILTYGMETAFFRFFSKSDQKEKVYSTVFLSLTISTILISLLLYACKTPILGVLELPESYFWYLAGVVLLDTLVVAPFAYLRARGKALRFAGFKLANLCIYVVLNFFFLWATPKFNWQFGWYDTTDLRQYIFIANLVASIVTLALIFPEFFKVKAVFDKKIFKKLWSYSWPIMVAGLAFVVNEQLDKLFINKMLNKEIGGAYAACYKIAVFMTIFIQAFRLGAEPFFFNHAKEKNAPSTYALILKYFVIVGAFGLLIITSFVDLIKDQLVEDSSYHLAMEIVPYVLLANLCLGIYHNLAIWYKLTDKTRYGMYFSIIGAIITICFNVFLIPVIGFMASAYATLAAYGSMMVLSYIFGKKHYPIPYDFKRISAYLLLAIICSGVSFYIFRANYLVSAILLGIFAMVIFFMERKQLKVILKRS